MQERKQVAVITRLNRYPVKSMQGESVPSLRATFKGFEGDRQYAFVKDGADQGFPWFTGRDFPQMTLFKPLVDRQTGRIDVELPDGKTHPLASDELRKLLIDSSTRHPNIHVMRLDRGAYDGFHASIMGNETIRAVSERSGQESDSRRFRANIEVETVEKKEGAEDEWVGGILTFGDREDAPQLFVVRRDPRCMMININPNTGHQDPQVLKDVYKNRGQEMGIYANIIKEGELRVGEPVFFTKVE